MLLGKALAQEAQVFLDRIIQLEEEQELIPLKWAQWLAIRSCLQVQLQLRLVWGARKPVGTFLQSCDQLKSSDVAQLRSRLEYISTDVAGV